MPGAELSILLVPLHVILTPNPPRWVAFPGMHKWKLREIKNDLSKVAKKWPSWAFISGLVANLML